MPRILVIEDDSTLQDAYGFILDADGHTVDAALNGKIGLTLATRNTYDIILLDIHMPVMNGWEFLKAYKDTKPDTTKIIVFSNMIEPDIEKQAQKLGAYKCVLKSSMTPTTMLTLIKDTLG